MLDLDALARLQARLYDGSGGVLAPSAPPRPEVSAERRCPHLHARPPTEEAAA